MFAQIDRDSDGCFTVVVSTETDAWNPSICRDAMDLAINAYSRIAAQERITNTEETQE